MCSNNSQSRLHVGQPNPMQMAVSRSIWVNKKKKKTLDSMS